MPLDQYDLEEPVRVPSLGIQIINLIEGDVGFLVIALVVFGYIGAWAVTANPAVRSWGWRSAFLAFVAYVLYCVNRDGFTDSRVLASAAFRGVLAGGLVLGISWIVFAIVHFVVAIPWRFMRSRMQMASYRRQQRRRDREQARQDRIWQRAAPAREAEARRASQERELALQRKNVDHQRREDARFACERYFDRYRMKLAAKFPEERIEAYFARYLGDDQSVEEVERRSAELLGTLKELVAQEDDEDPKRPRFKSIMQLNEHFEEQVRCIEQSNFDAERKASMIAFLERDRDLAFRKLHER